jgi:8-oxo-dGTP pyrophosphatase MutT (NUDIX family)
VELPDWLRPLATASERVDPLELSRFLPPDDPSVRQSAVLILLADGNDEVGDEAKGSGPDVLLTERAWTLRSHAGQMAFPGGRSDEEDGTGVEGLVKTALR